MISRLAALMLLWQQDEPGRVTNVFFGHAGQSGPVAAQGARESWLALGFFLPFILLAELLLLIVIFKFRDRGDGRKPATFHENVPLELLWTIVPAIVVTLMALHSFGVLRFDEFGGTNPAVNITVVGHQFFWEYKYPQYNIDLSNSDMVVPANEVVNLDLTSVDVIHGFYVPDLGIQEDALPGRLTNLWFSARPGHYKGQCTQLCGVNHSQMLIDVQVVSPDQFAQWVASQQKKAALHAPGSPIPAPAAASAMAAMPAGRPAAPASAMPMPGMNARPAHPSPPAEGNR